jgi:hypothetical protein
MLKQTITINNNFVSLIYLFYQNAKLTVKPPVTEAAHTDEEDFFYM